ncbi:MAG TPA: hypothetical protein VNX68_09325 [Nitrosopumilaceae archaeon]|nr:hypothetical protein [Nitrosopumilaceae archaeon]
MQNKIRIRYQIPEINKVEPDLIFFFGIPFETKKILTQIITHPFKVNKGPAWKTGKSKKASAENQML